MQGQSAKTDETPKTEQPSKAKKTPGTQKSASQAPVKFQGPFDSLTEFSATMVGSLFDNIDEVPVYRSGSKMRVQSWNKFDYFITDISTHDTYMMLTKPKKRCSYHNALPIQTFPFNFFRPPGYKFERTPMGEEVIEGHPCHVESVVRTAPSGATMKVRFWEADDLKGFPIKVEVDRPGGRVVTIAFKDVKLERPDPALFKHEAHCQYNLGSPKHVPK
jgi:hypothetical protein